MVTFDTDSLSRFPIEPGIYMMKDKNGRVLYIGKAKNIRNRVKQYFGKSDERPMIPILIAQIATIETLIVPSEKEALILENNLIKEHQPKYNVLLKDDKTFVGLAINHQHPWPKLSLLRVRGKPSPDLLYFGPYTNGFAAKQTAELMNRLFPLRECSDQELLKRKRPCILYSMKRCLAPCMNLCSHEEYASFVKSAVNFLKGKNKEIALELKRKRDEASEALEFERAASFQQTLIQIEHILEGDRLVESADYPDCDVLALYREGDETVLMQLIIRGGKLCGSGHFSFSHTLESDEQIYTSFLLQHYKNKEGTPRLFLLPKLLEETAAISELLSEGHPFTVKIGCPQKGKKRELVELAENNAKSHFKKTETKTIENSKLLLDLQEKLQLSKFPKTIECFDISNTSGSDTVASLACFVSGEKETSLYRLYKITTSNDDYGSLREALLRRLTKGKESGNLPDLILVDGGKGQLGILKELLLELNIINVDIASVVKEDSRHDKGMTAERVFIPSQKEPISFAPNSPLLFLLQRIRDEAHRRAIDYHRKRRSKRTLASWLDDLPGIGPKKRAALLSHFGSPSAIASASLNDLQKVKGISAKDALTLKQKKN